jgi:hypothetical protein
VLNKGEATDVRVARNLHYPEPLIAEGAKIMGFNNIAKSKSNKIHLCIQVVRYSNDYYPPVSLQVAKCFFDLEHESLYLKLNQSIRVTNGNRMPVSINGTNMINFYGPAKTFQHISALDILGKSFNKNILKGKIAVIGVTDLSLKRVSDIHRSPFDLNLTSSELWANIIENTIIPTNSFINDSTLILTLFIPLLVIIGLAFFTPLVAGYNFKKQALMILGIVIFLSVFAFILFLLELWLSIFIPLAYLAGMTGFFFYQRMRFGGATTAIDFGTTSGLSETAQFDQTGQLLRIGRYQIIKEIGSGAMGTVYKATDPKIDRVVAIKTVKIETGFGSNQELHQRFLREAHAAGMLSHPAIVTIYDCGDTENLSYIAMEYLEGTSLADKIAQNDLTVRETVDIISQIAKGLSIAHAQGIIHRDVKPANIMLVGSTHAVKIMDFGIAKITDATMTQTGRTLGTPYYMSPEQINGQTIDQRADIFSLGVIAYECLCMQRPFTGHNFSALSYAVLNKNPDAVSDVNPDINPSANNVFEKVLAKNREDRYGDAKDFAGAMARALLGEDEQS